MCAPLTLIAFIDIDCFRCRLKQSLHRLSLRHACQCWACAGLSPVDMHLEITQPAASIRKLSPSDALLTFSDLQDTNLAGYGLDLESRLLFRHVPFPCSGPDLIRLLRIVPGENSEPIVCSLQEENLSVGRERYVALSYMWGPAVEEKVIFIDGKRMPVRKSLWLFLQRARSLFPNTNFWVDAICIDQHNNDERSQQVHKMGRIYLQAQKVLIWLGEQKPQINDWIPVLLHSFQRRHSLLGQPGHLPLILDALVTVLNFPYWSRTWIIQELYLARNIELLYQSFTIEWEAFWQGYDRIIHMNLGKFVWQEAWQSAITSKAVHHRAVRQCLIGEQTKEHIGSLKPYNVRNDLPQLLDQYADTQCGDLRDKIYALLALARGGDSFAVEYRETPAALASRAFNHWSPRVQENCKASFIEQLLRALDISTPANIPWLSRWLVQLVPMTYYYIPRVDKVDVSRVSVRLRYFLRACKACGEINNDLANDNHVYRCTNEVRQHPTSDVACFFGESPTPQVLTKLTMLCNHRTLLVPANGDLWYSRGAFHAILKLLFLRPRELERQSLPLDTNLFEHVVELLLSDDTATRARFSESDLRRVFLGHLNIEVTPFLDYTENEVKRHPCPRLWAKWKAGYDFLPGNFESLTSDANGRRPVANNGRMVNRKKYLRTTPCRDWKLLGQ